MKKLYIILLGKSSSNELVEQHKIVYVAAENKKEAEIFAKKKWKVSNVHVDGIKMLEKVDGYKIILRQ